MCSCHIFQSTLRRTERRKCCIYCAGNCYFNPRSDERSDQIRWSACMVRGYFNPRSDERSDTPLFFKMYNKLYFNPRSDERSDIAGQVPVSFSLISIHAPTNGATAILHKKMKKTIQNRLIILLFSTNSLRLLCSCTQYSFFLFIFHGANDLVILCSLSFRTTSKN